MNRSLFRSVFAVLLVAVGWWLPLRLEFAEGAKALDAPPPIPTRDLSGAASVPVIRVLDGQTLIVDRDGSEFTVRLVGVDAPQTEGSPREGEFYGDECTELLINLLSGEGVRVVEDPKFGQDRLGRTLAHVYREPDGLWVNLEVVRQGYAKVWSGEPIDEATLFAAYQSRAREAKKGPWNLDRRAEWAKGRVSPTRPPATGRPSSPAQEELAPVPQKICGLRDAHRHQVPPRRLQLPWQQLDPNGSRGSEEAIQPLSQMWPTKLIAILLANEASIH